MLARCASGFGAVALAALGQDRSFGATLANTDEADFAGHGTHHPARAKNVIFLYMDGGPAQMDTFDPKPTLDKYNGQDPGKMFTVEPTQFNTTERCSRALGSSNRMASRGFLSAICFRM